MEERFGYEVQSTTEKPVTTGRVIMTGHVVTGKPVLVGKTVIAGKTIVAAKEDFQEAEKIASADVPVKLPEAEAALIEMTEPTEPTEPSVQAAEVIKSPDQSGDGSDTLLIEETDTVDVKCSIDKKHFRELAGISYEHGRETLKKYCRADWFVTGTGLFAMACLCVCGYNVWEYGIDRLFGVLMGVYALVALYCLIPRFQYMFWHILWMKQFPAKLRSRKAEGELAHFGEENVTFTVDGKEVKIPYEKMWDSYITADYYIFHISDRFILPVSRENVLEAEKEYIGADFLAYFEVLCERCKHIPEKYRSKKH